MRAEDSTKRLCIYLVEDEDDLREEMVYSLSQFGFDVVGLSNALELYKAYALKRCDIAVIDISLPGEDGLSIAAHLRSTGPVGIVLATARGALRDRVSGLQTGADAYLVKPINMEELAATLRAVGRRVRGMLASALATPSPPSPARWHLSEADWVLNDPAGRRLTLTGVERDFLRCLFKNHGKVVSRAQIIRALRGDAQESDPQRVDTIAFRLRRKAQLSSMELPLHTVRGQGYMLAK